MPLRNCLVTPAGASFHSLSGCRKGSCLTRSEPHQDGIRIDWGALPPFFVRTQFEDREVEVWRLAGRIAGRPHITDDVALLHRHAFPQPIGVMVEVRVIEAVNTGRVELVD